MVVSLSAMQALEKERHARQEAEQSSASLSRRADQAVQQYTTLQGSVSQAEERLQIEQQRRYLAQH